MPSLEGQVVSGLGWIETVQKTALSFGSSSTKQEPFPPGSDGTNYSPDWGFLKRKKREKALRTVDKWDEASSDPPKVENLYKGFSSNDKLETNTG